MIPFLKNEASILLIPDPTWTWVGWDGHLTVNSLTKPLHLSGDNIIVKSDVDLFMLNSVQQYISLSFTVPGTIAIATFTVDTPTLSDKIKVRKASPLLETTTGKFICTVATPAVQPSVPPVLDAIVIKNGTWIVVEPNQEIAFRNNANFSAIDQLEGPSTDALISQLSYPEKMLLAIKQSNVGAALLAEFGDLKTLAATMAVMGGFLGALALIPGGALVEAVGAGLLLAGVAMSGYQIGEGINDLTAFYQKTKDAKTWGEIENAGAHFGSAVAKLGIGGVNVAMGVAGARKVPLAGARSAEPLKKSYRDFDTKKVIDFRTLTGDEKVAKDVMKAQGRHFSEIKQVIESGKNFESVPLEKNTKLYGFGNGDWAKRKESAFWITESQYDNLKKEHFVNGRWDTQAIKQKTALPCTNRADTVYMSEVTESHKAVRSDINPASESLYTFDPASAKVSRTQKEMIGGGKQITPHPRLMSEPKALF